MSVLVIPTFDDPFYTQTTVIEGASYVFEFRYNEREDTWSFSLSLPDGTALATGRKIVCNKDLLGLSDTRFPPGILMAVSNMPDDRPPGMGELGPAERVSLLYFTSDTRKQT